MAAVTNSAISIGEVSRLSGLSPHTLRFYEAEGILMPAGRTASGHRKYRCEDVLWLEFVLRLKLIGMPLAEIKRFAALRSQGEKTLQPRLTMLKLHRERLVTKIDELSTCADVLEGKIRTYRKMIAKSRTPTKKADK
jgi:DNA-binding transcriptional MerR regulator